MNPAWRSGLCAVFSVVGALATFGLSASASELAAHEVGPVTYLNIDDQALRDGALGDKEAALYPLELDFLWGRGWKQTRIDGVEWTIATPSGHPLAKAPASGPVVLAALPDGRYTVTGSHDGKSVRRSVTVRQGEQATVPLEWDQ